MLSLHRCLSALVLLALTLAAHVSFVTASPPTPVTVLVEQPSDSPATSLLSAMVSRTAAFSARSATLLSAAHLVSPLVIPSRVAHSSAVGLSAVRLFHCQSASPARLPTLFLSHGGGPSFFMDVSDARFADISRDSPAFHSLAALPTQLNLTGSRRPRALLVISGHWESDDKTVHITARPSYDSLLFDYYGFPPHTYQLTYDAPGNVQLSQRVHSLLSGSGIKSQLDTERPGFDHGVFIPLMVAFPAADIPIVQVSMLASYDPQAHLALGKALAPLRDEGVLIIGSGFITHNFNPTVSPKPFMERICHVLTQASPQEREKALINWRSIEGATDAHKRADHFMPLFVAVGAAGEDKGTELFRAYVMHDMWSFAHYSFE